MDEQQSPKKKPRIRKAMPSMRERAEKASSKSEEQASRASKLFRPLGGFLSKLLTRNPAWRLLGKLLGRITPRYFINSWREVRQVAWPNRRETWRLTAAVFVFAIVFGASVALVDKGLQEIFRNVVLK